MMDIIDVIFFLLLFIVLSSGHNVPRGSETHFKVICVSSQFEEVKLIQRHRNVQALLSEYLQPGRVHALSIVAKTPAQWDKINIVPESPKCLGGLRFCLNFYLPSTRLIAKYHIILFFSRRKQTMTCSMAIEKHDHLHTLI